MGVRGPKEGDDVDRWLVDVVGWLGVTQRMADEGRWGG